MKLFSLKNLNQYKIAVFISSTSLAFGIFREFLIVALLGFSAKNDNLQIYLSIFYTSGLMIDAMRLACLNLFTSLSFSRIVLCASLVSLPFVIGLGLVMNHFTPANQELLIITIIGSFLNLIAALLITYRQRQNFFLFAQIINVLPNFILIPGIVICYWAANDDLTHSIVWLTSLIPVAQCLLLLSRRNFIKLDTEKNTISTLAAMFLIIKHFSVVLGEQLLQIITRAAFFNYGTGYLSIYAIAVRIYTALRFILIDSYIGSKLIEWKSKFQREDYIILKIANSFKFNLIIISCAFLTSLPSYTMLWQSSLQIVVLFFFGFYLSTLVRIIYFRLNHHENNSNLILRFASYEYLFFISAYLITLRPSYPVMMLLWLGYVAKPFMQLLLLRKKFINLQLIKENQVELFQ